MKSYVKQGLITLAIFSLLPVAAFAQPVDRGASIGSSRMGNGTRSYTQKGNQIRVKHEKESRTITVNEANRDIEVVVYLDGRIRVKITREYGPDDLNKLIRRAPELKGHLDSFPEVSGDKQVELSVRLTSTVEGMDEAELRNKDKAAFGLYKQYQQEMSRTGVTGRRYNPTTPRRPSRRTIGPVVPSGDGGELQPSLLDPEQEGGGDDRKKRDPSSAKIHL